MENNNGIIKNNRAALRALSQEYARLQDEMLEGFLVKLVGDNYFLWEVGIFGPPDTLYEGGYFRAELCFPADYPYSPPTMVFLTKIFHPNIYQNGRVSISILQPTTSNFGDNYSDRWNPTQNVRTILLSVISLLNEPNIQSTANAKAAFWYRCQCESKGHDTRYREAVLKLVSESKQYALEMGIRVPTTREEYCVKYRPESTARRAEPVYADSAFMFFGSDNEEEEEQEEEDDEEDDEDDKKEDKKEDQKDEEENDDEELDSDQKPKKRKKQD